MEAELCKILFWSLAGAILGRLIAQTILLLWYELIDMEFRVGDGKLFLHLYEWTEERYFAFRTWLMIRRERSER